MGNGTMFIIGALRREKFFLGEEDFLKFLRGTEVVLNQFRDIEEYKKFAKIAIEESRKRKDLEKYLLEKLGS